MYRQGDIGRGDMSWSLDFEVPPTGVEFDILGWDAFDLPHWREGVKISSSLAAYYYCVLVHVLALFLVESRLLHDIVNKVAQNASKYTILTAN